MADGQHDPFSHDGSTEVGVLVCHGFTGSPRSMRPWAQHLVEQGWTVRLPLLPGHGTTWQEANTTTWQDWYGCVDAAFGELRERCDQVFVVGLSMGGALTLRLAELHGPDVAGIVLVNPIVAMLQPQTRLLPVLSRMVASMPAIGNDIAMPGVQEGAYERTPLRAAASLRSFLRLVRADLPKVDQPMRLFHSAQDHVVEPENSAIVLREVNSTDVAEIVLADSYHVATLDYDAETIFTGSVDFIRGLSEQADNA
ncbi:alpha/beta fold hydrolase [Catellatospora sp. NPDC049609]|uniref:alpha/beta hydrolase n=1 Tax=Catellatospora sp. NPDC049609 TaxID=3155505 RepID=UPI00343DCAEE